MSQRWRARTATIRSDNARHSGCYRLLIAEQTLMNLASRIAPAFGVLDSPSAGQVVNGALHSHGWVVQLLPLNAAIRFLIDDRPVAAQINQVARPDVHLAYPHLVAGNPTPGFEAVINLGDCAAGDHTLTCQAVWHDAFAEQVKIIGQVMVAVQNDAPLPPAQFAARQALRFYLKGDGVEIGALHSPLDLTGLSISRLRYVDRITVAEARQTYPELAGHALVQVDVIDDGETLSSFSDASLDFIIGNHLIEHASNLFGTLNNWLRKLRAGGVIFMAIPDKRYTFDADRPLTPLNHIIEDYLATPDERRQRDQEHYHEWVAAVEKTPADQRSQRARQLMEAGYSIHYHTFVLKSFLQLLGQAQAQLNLPFEIAACADTVPGSNEFVVVLRKS